MRVTVIFYDLGSKWEKEVCSDHELTCSEAAGLALEAQNRSADSLKGVIYLSGDTRKQADDLLSDGECLSVHRLLGGG